MKLHQHTSPMLLEMKAVPSLHNLLRTKKADECVWNEIEAWAHSELENGGTITKQEAHDALSALAKKHGVEIPDEVWAALEEIFDAIDTDGNGELDAGEVKAALDHVTEGQDWEDVQLPTEEEVRAWIHEELAKDGDITKKEAADAVKAWANSQGVVVPKEVWKALEASFDAVDANGDGKLTAEELEAAFE